MRIITLDDIIDTYSKISQRGYAFFFSKFTFNRNSRAISAFDESAEQTSNWWIIPAVQKRWNVLISGNENIEYKEYYVTTFFKNKTDLKILSLGSGSCAHEIELASYPNFSEITCVDINQANLDLGASIANKKGLKNLKFLCADVNLYDLPQNYYDLVIFNDSLHHFQNVENLLSTKIKDCLHSNGKLIIHEFVGPKRMQFPAKQIKAVNVALQLIDKKYRKRFKTNFIKSKFYGSGILRVIMADPSECIDSNNILPAIHKHFKVIEEKPYGGNILMSTLKEISHHFVNLNGEKEEILKNLFIFEDEYLKENTSDFMFGVYEKEIN